MPAGAPTICVSHRYAGDLAGPEPSILMQHLPSPCMQFGVTPLVKAGGGSSGNSVLLMWSVL